MLYDVMSITKAAIGLVYTYRGNITEYEESLLNMQYTEDWDDDTTFTEFRTLVEKGGSLKHFATKCLYKNNSFSYCNLAYQLLTYKNLADDFGKLVGRPVMKRENRWVYGVGWKWEISTSGEILGPHGLHISDEVGRIMGELAKTLFIDPMPVPIGLGWGGIGNNILTGYYRGWFYRGDGAIFAIGFVAQIIGVHCDNVSVSFHVQDWDTYDNWKDKAIQKGNDFISNMSDIIIRF